MPLLSYNDIMQLKLNRMREINETRYDLDIDSDLRDEMFLLIDESKHYTEQMYERYRDVKKRLKDHQSRLDDDLSLDPWEIDEWEAPDLNHSDD